MDRISFLILLLFIPLHISAQQAHSYYQWDTNARLNISELEAKQQSADISRFWLNIGPGIGTVGSFAGVAGISYQFGANLLTVRGSTTGDLLGEHYSDIGLLYGRVFSNDSFHTSFAAGLARVSGQRSEELFGSSDDISPTLGLPLELQTYWKAASFFGIGVTGFANINENQSFAGLALSVQLGKLR